MFFVNIIWLGYHPSLHKFIIIRIMDREIPVANRFIDRKMQQFRDKKHRQTLSQIRKKNHSLFCESSFIESTKNSRYNGGAIENKNLEIEKQNILLFNKIASIIRQKPKPNQNRSYANSLQNALVKQKKKQQRLRTENDLFQKRISQQKSTIQNKKFYKDRMKNVKYLKFIGRYPYDKLPKNDHIDLLQNSLSGVRSMRSISQSNQPTDIEVFRKKTDNFFVKITKISNSYYVFTIEIEGSNKSFQYTMNKSTFQDQFCKNGFNYEQMVGKLRLAKNQKIVFDHL